MIEHEHRKRENGSRDTLSSLIAEDGKLVSDKTHQFMMYTRCLTPREVRGLLKDQAKEIYMICLVKEVAILNKKLEDHW